MDSMRSLNTSLPGTSPPKQVTERPEQLLDAFKAAALSVTKLYKTAAQDQTRARSEGYQDALDDLLSFLDKEDIGLNDGEGWRIRRWATERLDGKDSASQNMESDDEAEKADREASPALQRAQSASQLLTRSESPVRTESAPPSIIPPITDILPSLAPPTSAFTFRSPYAYPEEVEMNIEDQDADNTRGPQLETSVVSNSARSASPAITISRQTRSTPRHNNQSGRHNVRTSGIIGRGAGQKRKINYGDFFDLGNLGHGKDGFGGGGKRGKFA